MGTPHGGANTGRMPQVLRGVLSSPSSSRRPRGPFSWGADEEGSLYSGAPGSDPGCLWVSPTVGVVQIRGRRMGLNVNRGWQRCCRPDLRPPPGGGRK